MFPNHLADLGTNQQMGRLHQITQLKKYTVGEIFYFFLVFPLVHQVGFTILAYLFLNTETTIVFNHFAGPRKMCTLEQTSLLLDLTYQFFPKIFTEKAFPQVSIPFFQSS